MLDQLETELDNIRTAMEWALERNPQTALQLAASLPRFWQCRGKLSEGRRWLDDSMIRFNALAPAEGDSGRRLQALKAKGLSAVGTLAFGQGELNASRTLLEESVALGRATGEQRTLFKALRMIEYAVMWLGEGQRADALL